MPEAQQEPTAAQDLRELTLRAREGDLESGYAILAEQVPVDTWVAVLAALKRRAADVDLELVAHRTLRRRPVAVPSAVLDLSSAATTPVAAFVARSVAKLRSEDDLVARGHQVADAISAKYSPTELLADARPLDALYAILALPLEQASVELRVIGPTDPARDELLEALRSEYERLQELAKDKRWRSGSYRHVLRHALADLALLAQVGGKLEDQAFRLLQQRTEDPAANRELLALLPEDTRRAYLAWVVGRPPGKEETARTLFALEEIEHRYQDDVPRSSLESLLASKDDSIAVAAAGLVVRTAPDDQTSDRAIAELVERLQPPDRAAVINGIAHDAPSRLRIDLWPPDVDRLLAESTEAGVSESLVGVFETSANPELRVRVLAVLLERDPDDELSCRVARAVLDRTSEPDAPELHALLAGPDTTRGVWTVMADSGAVRRRLLEQLIEIDGPTKAAHRLAAHAEALVAVDPLGVRGATLDAIEAGLLVVEPLAGTSFADSLAELAITRVERLEEQQHALAEVVGHGDRAAEFELARALAPLVGRAVDRSTGNERLLSAYRDLSPGELDATAPPDAMKLDPEEVAALERQLVKSGLRLEVMGDDVVVDIDGAANDVAQLRALALVDQRAVKATGDARWTAEQVRHAVAASLGRSGLAQRAMTDLVERGQLAPAVAALPGAARENLFDAAVAGGLVPPADWERNPVIAQWSNSRSDPPEPDFSRDPLVLLATLQDAASIVRETEAKLAAARDSARKAYFVASESTFDVLDDAEDVYVQFWLGLSRVGIERVAAPGAVLAAEDVDPERFEVVGDVRGRRYIVRYGGVTIGGDVLRRARVEATA